MAESGEGRFVRPASGTAAALLLAGSVAAHAGPPTHIANTRPPSTMAPNDWVSFDASASPLRRTVAAIDLTPSLDKVEEITVLGRRLRSTEEPKRAAAPLKLGPATLEGSSGHVGGFEGTRVTAAVPLGGVPGLDAVVNVSGGYDQRSENRTVNEGAVTAGIRLRF